MIERTSALYKFLQYWYKYQNFEAIGKEYAALVEQTHIKTLEQLGVSVIPGNESTTGEPISFMIDADGQPVTL